MKDILVKELKTLKTREEKFNRLRELLQIIILKIIYDSNFSKNLVFTGGTALRILFDLKRFSEDLDFSLVNKKGYSLNKFITLLKRQLRHYMLEVDLKAKEEKTVHQLDIRFRHVLFDFHISDISQQKLFIKIEIDTKPPSGGNIEISLVQKLFFFTVTHFDLASLYATKLHACFFRKYTKGRDFYDLMWYLAKKIEPNYTLLNNAIRQTKGDKSIIINHNNFKKFLMDNLSKVNFKAVVKEVERFLPDKEELKYLNKNILISLVNKLW